MYLARSIIALLSLVVTNIYGATPGAPARDESADGRVELAMRGRVEQHRPKALIGKPCRVEGDVVGCTDFPIEQLVCQCTLRTDGWVIDSVANIETVIHVSDRQPYHKVLHHEQLHWTDLEVNLRGHLAQIASLRYESREACENLAKVMSSPSYLRDVMNRLRIGSNEKYHCTRLNLRAAR